MKRRHVHAEAGTCLVDLCHDIVCAGPVRPGFADNVTRGYCKKHAAATDIQIREREARGETAQVLRLADYERDEYGRVQRRT